MNPRTKKKMDTINQRLADYNQLTRLIELSPSYVKLNSLKEFRGADVIKFIKRIMNTKVIEWVKNTDKLLNGEMSETEIKNISFSIGGKACQQKHKEKIKQNLNTGLPWNKGTKGQNVGKLGPRTDEVKKKISEKNKGVNNGRFGYKYTEQEKLDKSTAMKQAIISGKFTPKLNNRNTHWESRLDETYYRSSWEALYKYINHSAVYEELRLVYDHMGKEKIYIVDFIDHVNKLVVEVKPKELCVGDKFNSKLEVLTNWANQHNYEVLVVDQYWFLNISLTKIDLTRFDEKTVAKIRKLYEASKTN